MTNHLYYGDNLAVLRDRIASASVDLIYLDPPFNSNADYNQLFKTPKGHASPAQMEAFTDTWQWDDAISGLAVEEVKRSSYQDAAKMLDAMVGFLGKNALTAYLAMMAVRLIELHRVLKPTSHHIGRSLNVDPKLIDISTKKGGSMRFVKLIMSSHLATTIPQHLPIGVF